MNTVSITRIGFAAILAVSLIAAAIYVLRPGDTGATASDRDVVDAPIESVVVSTLKSNPAQYDVRIVSGLPSGCAEYAATEVTGREGNTIFVRVTNTMPTGDIACTMIYGMHESNINIGSDFKTGETYTVDVNGTTVEFVAR